MSEIVPETGSARTFAGSGFGGKTVDGCAAISFKPSASVAIGGVPLARSSTAKPYPKPRPDADFYLTVSSATACHHARRNRMLSPGSPRSRAPEEPVAC